MKTKIGNIIAGLILIFGFTAGYEDKGNYDYTSLPDIQVDSLVEIYSVTQFDALKIKPEVHLDGLENFSYSWRIWTDALANSEFIEISDQKELKYQVKEIPGSYTMVFTVTDEKRNVNVYKSMKLKVQGVVTDGWMILHEKEGKSDFDLLISPFFTNRVSKDSRFINMYEAMNGETLPGGKGVRISSYFTGNYQYVYVMTENAGVRLSAINMQKMSDLSSLILDGKPLKPENYSFIPYGSLNRFAEEVISDGRYYISNFGYNLFTEPVCRDGLTYQAAPYMPRWLAWGMRGVIYDQLHGRFLMVVNSVLNFEKMTPTAGSIFDWNKMNATMIYLESGFNKYEYAVMQDWTTGKRALCVIDFKGEGGTYAIAEYATDKCPEFAQADGFAIGGRGNVFYYSAGNQVYLYDYSGANEAKSVIKMTNDEIITNLELQKPNEGYYMKNHPYDNKVLVVATYNEKTGEGKVYMYYVNEANGTVDLASVKVWKGFGRILDVEFNYAKYGS